MTIAWKQKWWFKLYFKLLHHVKPVYAETDYKMAIQACKGKPTDKVLPCMCTMLNLLTIAYYVLKSYSKKKTVHHNCLACFGYIYI